MDKMESITVTPKQYVPFENFIDIGRAWVYPS